MPQTLQPPVIVGWTRLDNDPNRVILP